MHLFKYYHKLFFHECILCVWMDGIYWKHWRQHKWFIITTDFVFHKDHNLTAMCLPDLENLIFSIPIFCKICPILKQKHPILTKLGAFYNNLHKIHPIYVIWAPSSPPIAIPNFVKNTQKAGTYYTYTMSIWDPPRTQVAEILLRHTGVAKFLPLVVHPPKDQNKEENLRKNERKYRKMRKDWGNIRILPT